MKCKPVALVLLAALMAPAGAITMSPVTRVVELLKGLSEKIGSDAKIEEDLYDKYVCWAKTTMDAKTASNSAAQARADELNAYIADLDAGRVELTSERSDLVKELAEINSDIETATAQRNKEASDFDSAKTEMEQGIAALESAVEVLGTATSGNTGGVLLSTKTNVNEGFAARTRESQVLLHAVDVGRKFLGASDARFLEHLLSGDVPEADWKKLNRKATFKQSYKARSFKIQGVLAQLLASFQASLKDAQDKEKDAIANFNTLHSAKTAQKTAAETALNNGDAEGGARGLSRAESVQEASDLTTQINNDKGFISQTVSALATKKLEFKDRKVLRAGEQEAIAKAVEILHNDDSRDLFKKSFDSQGYFFLQVQENSVAEARAARLYKSALEQIRETAVKSHDQRLLALAARLSLKSGTRTFMFIIEAIDKMISALNQEEADDLENKEQCEKDRADDTRAAAETARRMDELSDKISMRESEIADIKVEIKDKQDQIAAIEQEKKEATDIRNKENADFVSTNKDDRDAADTVQRAIDVLSSFYSENFGLLQKAKGVPGQAGEAPPPPPPTWTDSYGGKQGEQQGIVAILTLIKEDILKDKQKAKAEEDASLSAYNNLIVEADSQISTLNSETSTLNSDKSTKESEVTTKKGTRNTKKGELDVLMKTISDAQPGCDYLLVSYMTRVENRHMEIDGLNRAKDILSDADAGMHGPVPAPAPAL